MLIVVQQQKSDAFKNIFLLELRSRAENLVIDFRAISTDDLTAFETPSV